METEFQLGVDYDREYRLSNESALIEARSIVHAMKQGVDMSDVFSVSPKTAAYLARCAEEDEGDARVISVAMDSRRLVQRYVDQFLAEGVLPRVEEAEDPVEASPSSGTFTILTERFGDASEDEDDPPEEEA